jgi:hypothetical protein
VHRKTLIRSGANKIAEVVGEKIKKQRERKKRRTLQNWRCFQLVRKPRSYMNTHIQLRSNVHLNAPIRSRLATPIEKTKTKKERKNALWFIVAANGQYMIITLFADKRKSQQQRSKQPIRQRHSRNSGTTKLFPFRLQS